MGQQQLLFLVLGIVVVGLAVVAGIDLFERSMKQRHVDMLVNHTVMVASEAITWRTKGSPFLGGGGDYQSLDTEGMTQILMNERRPPGTIKITRATANEIDITAVSNDYPNIGVITKVVGEEIVETTIAYDGSITLPDVTDGG